MLYLKFLKINVLLILASFFLISATNENVQAQKTKRPAVSAVRTEIKVELEPPDIPDKIFTPEQKRRLETFRIVWRTIKENYFDQTFSGLNWNNIKAEYEPQVAKFKTDAELHYLLQKMIDRLNRSHFAIIPPEVLYALERAKQTAKEEGDELSEKYNSENSEEDDDEETENSDEDYYATYGIGVELRVLDGQFVITRVELNSAAEKAGLKIGYIINNINTVSLDTLLKSADAAESKKYKKQLPLAIVSYFLNGERDVPVLLNYLDGDDKLQEKVIMREKLSGESVKLLSNLPSQFVRFDAESLDEDTGYIKFNFFAVSLVDKFCGAVGKFKDKKNLIIDLRGNLGGSLGTLFGITSLLTDRTIKLGTEINKLRREDRYVKAQRKNFKGRIVILIDNMSYSAAELFAAALQENDRATVIGETSAGEALPSLTMELPTGAVFLYPVANFETPKGNPLEGRGVQPDLKVALERKTLLFGVDKQLESALAFLKIPPAQNPATKTNTNTSSIKPPPPPAPIQRPNDQQKSSEIKIKQDAKALQIIDDFVTKIGGKAALGKISSYTATGTAIINRAGAKVYGTIGIYRDSPNKLAEISEFDAIGKISEVYDGKEFFAQTTILGTDDKAPPEYVNERKLFSEFNEILEMRQLYPQINYIGSYEREGEPTHLIEAVSSDGSKVIFAFNAKTNLLVNRTGKFIVADFGDYRKVGEILFPFHQTRFGMFEFNLTKVNLNEKPDENVFLPGESCFDKN